MRDFRDSVSCPGSWPVQPRLPKYAIGSVDAKMIKGKLYRLRTPMLSVDPDKETTVLIPQGEIIQIDKVRHLHRRSVDVLWNGRILLLFMADIEDRCDEVAER